MRGGPPAAQLSLFCTALLVLVRVGVCVGVRVCTCCRAICVGEEWLSLIRLRQHTVAGQQVFHALETNN